MSDFRNDSVYEMFYFEGDFLIMCETVSVLSSFLLSRFKAFRKCLICNVWEALLSSPFLSCFHLQSSSLHLQLKTPRHRPPPH